MQLRLVCPTDERSDSPPGILLGSIKIPRWVVPRSIQLRDTAVRELLRLRDPRQRPRPRLLLVRTCPLLLNSTAAHRPRNVPSVTYYLHVFVSFSSTLFLLFSFAIEDCVIQLGSSSLWIAAVGAMICQKFEQKYVQPIYSTINTSGRNQHCPVRGTGGTV